MRAERNDRPPAVQALAALPITRNVRISVLAASACLLAAGLLASPAARASYRQTVVATAGLAALYPMNDAGTVTDALGGPSATVHGASVTDSATADSDAALSFTAADGDYLDVAAPATPAGQLTVEAWVRPTGSGVRDIAARGTITSGYQLLIEGNGHLAFTVGTGSGRSAVTLTGPQVAPGVWSHIAATLNARTMTVFVNGDAAALMRTSDPQISGATMTIGRDAASARRYFDGAIDELAVYGAPLDASTIAAHDASGLADHASITHTDGPPAVSNLQQATFHWDGDGASYACALDGGEWASCASGYRIDVEPGQHTLLVRPYDKWGRAGADASLGFAIDRSAPHTLLMAATSNLRDPIIAAASEPGAHVDCRIDDGPWQPCPGEWAPDAPGAEHVVSARATDAAGNTDAHPPTITLPAAGEVFAAAPYLDVRAASSAGKTQCLLGGWVDCRQPQRADASFGAQPVQARAGELTVQATALMLAPPPALAGVSGPTLVELYRAPAGREADAALLHLQANVASDITVTVQRCVATGCRPAGRSWATPVPLGGAALRLPPSLLGALPSGRYRLAIDANAASGHTQSATAPFALLGRGRWASTRRGGAGPDRLRAHGAGPQHLVGDGGADRIWGGPASDLLEGQTGPDHIDGVGGDDILDGSSGGDVLEGGAGDDVLIGYYGHDRLNGGPGDDVLDGGGAIDLLHGGPGDDTLVGGSGTDALYGDDGNDVLYPVSGSDSLYGGAGDDVLYANTGGAVHVADCGPGQDTLYITRMAKLPSGEWLPGAWSNHQMVAAGRAPGCERVIEADPLPVDPDKGQVLWAGDAGGHVTGTAKDDTLLGGRGSDVLDGAAGDDVIWGDHHEQEGGFDATDRLAGGDGDDKLYGGRGVNVIDGGAGSDFVQGGAGKRNTLLGGPGDDTLRARGDGATTILAGPGDDTVYALTSGSVTVHCGPGRDRVSASRSARIARDCETVTRRN